jgi:hypothetical protein
MKRIILILLFTAFAFADEQPTPAPSTGPSLVESQLFQVVLLRASRKGTDDLDGLPKSAEKALADVRDFLPFKHYVMLDSAMVRLAHGMSSSVTVNSYQVKFSYERKDNKLSIWWFTVYPASKKTEQPTPPPGRGDTPAYAPEAIKPLISTSFAMDRGETVVVGSSKLNGDDALMVLLTAVPAR